jgi:hypothetical protein
MAPPHLIYYDSQTCPYGTFYHTKINRLGAMSLDLANLSLDLVDRLLPAPSPAMCDSLPTSFSSLSLCSPAVLDDFGRKEAPI